MADAIPADVMALSITCAETVCRNLPYDDCSIEIAAIAKTIMRDRADRASRAPDAGVVEARKVALERAATRFVNVVWGELALSERSEAFRRRFFALRDLAEQDQGKKSPSTIRDGRG